MAGLAAARDSCRCFLRLMYPPYPRHCQRCALKAECMSSVLLARPISNCRQQSFNKADNKSSVSLALCWWQDTSVCPMALRASSPTCSPTAFNMYAVSSLVAQTL